MLVAPVVRFREKNYLSVIEKWGTTLFRINHERKTKEAFEYSEVEHWASKQKNIFPSSFFSKVTQSGVS